MQIFSGISETSLVTEFLGEMNSCLALTAFAIIISLPNLIPVLSAYYCKYIFQSLGLSFFFKATFISVSLWGEMEDGSVEHTFRSYILHYTTLHCTIPIHTILLL